jgi:hypothetical protein
MPVGACREITIVREQRVQSVTLGKIGVAWGAPLELGLAGLNKVKTYESFAENSRFTAVTCDVSGRVAPPTGGAKNVIIYRLIKTPRFPVDTRAAVISCTQRCDSS